MKPESLTWEHDLPVPLLLLKVGGRLYLPKTIQQLLTDHRLEGKGRRELQTSVSLTFVCMNTVESLLKHSMLGPTPEILIQLVQGRVHFRILSQVMQLMPVRG